MNQRFSDMSSRVKLLLTIHLLWPLKSLPRSVRFVLQKIFRGFSDRDTWCLSMTLARLMIPRIRRFKELNRGVPGSMIKEDSIADLESDRAFAKAVDLWDKTLDEIIEGFELVLEENTRMLSTEEYKKIDRAFKLLHKYHRDLWW